MLAGEEGFDPWMCTKFCHGICYKYNEHKHTVGNVIMGICEVSMLILFFFR
jgi:hypothetical protein